MSKNQRGHLYLKNDFGESRIFSGGAENQEAIAELSTEIEIDNATTH